MNTSVNYWTYINIKNFVWITKMRSISPSKDLDWMKVLELELFMIIEFWWVEYLINTWIDFQIFSSRSLNRSSFTPSDCLFKFVLLVFKHDFTSGAKNIAVSRRSLFSSSLHRSISFPSHTIKVVSCSTGTKNTARFSQLGATLFNEKWIKWPICVTFIFQKMILFLFSQNTMK